MHPDLNVRPSNQAAAHLRHTPAEVYAIRVAHADGASIYALAKRMGLQKITVSKIVRGITYRHVPMPEVTHA